MRFLSVLCDLFSLPNEPLEKDTKNDCAKFKRREILGRERPGSLGRDGRQVSDFIWEILALFEKMVDEEKEERSRALARVYSYLLSK